MDKAKSAKQFVVIVKKIYSLSGTVGHSGKLRSYDDLCMQTVGKVHIDGKMVAIYASMV